MWASTQPYLRWKTGRIERSLFTTRKADSAWVSRTCHFQSFTVSSLHVRLGAFASATGYKENGLENNCFSGRTDEFGLDLLIAPLQTFQKRSIFNAYWKRI